MVIEVYPEKWKVHQQKVASNKIDMLLYHKTSRW